MTKNKNLFKNISLFLCLVPMLIISLFCLFPKKDKMDVSALGDQVITNFNFVGSNIMLASTMRYVSGDTFDRQTFINVTLSFGVKDGVYSAYISGYADDANHSSTVELSGRLDRVPNLESLVSTDRFLNLYNITANSNSRYQVRVFHSGQLSSNIIKVQYSHYENLTPNSSKPANFYNTITYIDINGEFIEFQFPLHKEGQSFANKYLFEERTYYFTTSFDDNDFYELGKHDGLEEGYQNGLNAGYDNGYSVGSSVGYQDGFIAGLDSSNKYSFNSLIGAVIDAPVSAFTSLLNFELFGVNILGLITGLLSLAVIVLIIKLCMGGR